MNAFAQSFGRDHIRSVDGDLMYRPSEKVVWYAFAYDILAAMANHQRSIRSKFERLW